MKKLLFISESKHLQVSVMLFELFIFFTFSACVSKQSEQKKNNDFRPNILVISCEDISPLLGCYGDSIAITPNLDKLASEGTKYTHVFSTSGVCAPARCTLITGMYPTSIGGDNMRTLGNLRYIPAAITSYSIVPPPEVKCYSEFLREAGYYCTNNHKQDYQFVPPVTAWDESSKHATWKNRPENNPFFSIFNITVSHESRIWVNKNKPLYVDPEKVTVPPYYPDNMVVRNDIARNYSNIHLMDSLVGIYLKELDDTGLSDSTIVIFFSDGGGPLPRQKGEITDAGLRVPFIVRYPDKRNAGTVNDDLISFVDFAPTFLSLVGISPPKYMQGKAFLGEYTSPEKRKYIFAARDRIGSKYDMIRTVRDKQYAYFKNYYPNKPYIIGYNPNNEKPRGLYDRINMPMMRNIIQLHKEHKLNKDQDSWFGTKPPEELYDTQKDPYEMNNLASLPQYKEKLEELRHQLYKWQYNFGDMGFIPEKELIHIFWESNDGPQTTLNPEVVLLKDGTVQVLDHTEGSSIGYQVIGKDSPKHWNVYKGPLKFSANTTLKILAWRIGYQPSDTITYTFR